MKYVYVILLALFIPFVVFAHPGDTDSYGCHTCSTNCESWGLYTGQYHCHDIKKCIKPIVNCTQDKLDTLNRDLGSLRTTLGRNGGLETSAGISAIQGYEQQMDACRINIEKYSSDLSIYSTCLSNISNEPIVYKETPKLACDGGVIVNGVCMTYDGACQSYLGANSQYSNGNCICTGYHILYKNKCLTMEEMCRSFTGGHGHFDGKICICDADYVWSDKDQLCIAETKEIKVETSVPPVIVQEIVKPVTLEKLKENKVIKKEAILKLNNQEKIEATTSILTSTVSQEAIITSTVSRGQVTDNSPKPVQKGSVVGRITQGVGGFFINIFRRLKFW
ncbi:MAG: YHYH domain-containing protein [Patescibacteria group bacterium]